MRLICIISELVEITNYKLHIWNTNEFSYVTATSLIKKKKQINFISYELSNVLVITTNLSSISNLLIYSLY